MKKILILILTCTILIFGGATALAEGTEHVTEDMQTNNRTHTLEDLFDKYNPAEKQTYLNLKSDHQTFHENRQTARTETIQYYAGQMSAITGQVSQGAISPSEGREQLRALRSEIESLREDIKVISDQKHIEADSIKSDITALRDLIKSALQEEEIDSSQIASYLEQLNNLFEEHLEMDYKYADMVDDLLPIH